MTTTIESPKFEMTKHQCPVCKGLLAVKPGSVMRTDGVTVWCPNPCAAQEVMGYGKNELSAYEIIVQKYKL